MTAGTASERYELLEELGAGTSGAVYRARDRQLGREVALKLLFTERLDDPEVVRRLHREARVAAAFRHPNAVEIYEIGELDGRAFLAMELVQGRAMSDALADQPPPLPHAATVAIGREIADVLAAAHAVGLVHRDLKPSNIFVDGTLDAPARIRLVDFGLAFQTQPTSETMGRLTGEGFIVGTPAYMSPEQAEGITITPATDVYALGCILYELASGRTPFTGNIPKILMGHMFLPPMPLVELELEHPVPAALEAIIIALLEKAPDKRPTAATALAALRTVNVGDAPGARAVVAARTRAERAAFASNGNHIPMATHPTMQLGATPDLAPNPPVAALPAPTPADAEIPVRIALDPSITEDLAASLAAAGFSPVALNEAQVMVAALADDGRYDGTEQPSVPIVGLHAAPTPQVIALAIRSGVAAVARWPGDAEKLRARLRAAKKS